MVKLHADKAPESIKDFPGGQNIRPANQRRPDING